MKLLFFNISVNSFVVATISLPLLFNLLEVEKYLSTTGIRLQYLYQVALQANFRSFAFLLTQFLSN